MENKTKRTEKKQNIPKTEQNGNGKQKIENKTKG